MSGFAALMALSASQTKETESAVQSALKQRQQKEEMRRKQMEEQTRKEKENETKLRLKYFEDQKREQEREKQEEKAKEARQLALQRREDEQRDALRYGPKKAKASNSGEGGSKWPTSQSHSREEVKRRRLPDGDDDEGGDNAGMALTREEKRHLKLQAEIKRTFNSSKRSATHAAYGKAGRRLPGGAIDAPTNMSAADSSLSSQSVKARISAIPNTLTKLNTVKRDTRTIDEILQDRAKARDAKVLDGEEAKEFNDWFGKAKKKESPKKAPPASAPTSGTNTPQSYSSSKPVTSSQASGSSALIKKAVITKISAMSPAPNQKPTNNSAKPPIPLAMFTKTSTSTTSRMTSSDKHPAPKPKSSLPAIKTNIARSGASSTQHSAGQPRSGLSASTKKRPRSPSLSESPPPKRRVPSPTNNDLSTEIWKLFGKDRGSYVQRDVLSDDEDMEVDARFLEKEEKASARIAQREDAEAVEAERRHEEEKRRRKKEKDAREKRGY